MTAFALVHGGWHGAWCWERLTPLLQERGHEVVTMDLPGDDPAATFDTYADVVCEALSPHDDDVIVVGHSLAGLTIPLVAARRPVKRLVYLCALLPAPGRTWTQQVRAEPDMMRLGWDRALRTDESDRTSWADEKLAHSLLYADCDESTAAAAFARLRPQVGAGRWVCSLSEFPSTPSTSIHCVDDQVLNSDWSRRTSADRLGAEVIELPGSHSPFLSRPAAVADALLRVASAGLAD